MPAPCRTDPEPDDPGRGGELVLLQPAVPASLRPIRRSVRRWLDAAGWPLVAAEDIELAVNEAVANIIDHAYLGDDPGPIHLHAWITRATAPPATAPTAAALALPAAPPEVTAPVTATGTAPFTVPVVTMGAAAAAVPPPVIAVVTAPGFPTTAIALSEPDPPDPVEPADSAPPPGSKRRATIAVSDRGRWSPERRTIDPGGHRGHGLTVMTAVMAAVHLQRSARGTMVVLVSHPTPA